MQSSLLDLEVCPLLKIRYLITFIHCQRTSHGDTPTAAPASLNYVSTFPVC